MNYTESITCPSEIMDLLKEKYHDQIVYLADSYGGYFSQWHNDLYPEREKKSIHDKKVAFVLNEVIEKRDVLDINDIDLEKLKETSIDYYAALRSIARQKRKAEISNGAPSAGAPLPELNYDFNAEFTQ